MTRVQDFLNSPVAQVTVAPRNPKQGDLFGVELECEGLRVDFDGLDKDLLNSWAPHNDGSLRNNHGACCEWVFNGPVNYDQSIIRINKLFDYFDRRKAKLVTSNRTSTHVHFNMGDKNVYQAVNLFILFTILEDIFGRYCGEDRNGNLFCLSSRHAQDQVKWMEDSCLKYYDFTHLREDMRYCALNIASLNKFRTVEFRGMRGLDNRQDMLDWVSILNEFVNYACYKVHNPVDLIEGISVKTPVGLLKEIFSAGNYFKLTKNLTHEEINTSVFEGLRLVQMLCYRIGTEFDKVRLKGKDFWASFGKGPEPVPDVDPNVFLEGGGAIPKPRVRIAPAARPLDAFLDRPQPNRDDEHQIQAARELLRQVRVARDQAADPFEIGWQDIINPPKPMKMKVKKKIDDEF